LDAYTDFADCLGDKELSEIEKDKDRTAVREIAKILKVAGYTIVEASRSALHRRGAQLPSLEAGRTQAAARK
jgi:hypothetical protein